MSRLSERELEKALADLEGGPPAGAQYDELEYDLEDFDEYDLETQQEIIQVVCGRTYARTGVTLADAIKKYSGGDDA